MSISSDIINVLIIAICVYNFHLQTLTPENDICEAFMQQMEIEEFEDITADDLRNCVIQYGKMFSDELEVNNCSRLLINKLNSLIVQMFRRKQRKN